MERLSSDFVLISVSFFARLIFQLSVSQKVVFNVEQSLQIQALLGLKLAVIRVGPIRSENF